MRAKRDRRIRRAAAGAMGIGIVLSAATALADEPAAPPVQACVDAYQSTQELRLAGKVRLARERAAACAEESCPPAVRSGCTKWLRELIDSQPSLVVLARDGDKDVTDALVYVDDNPVSEALSGRPVEVDPGKHVIKLVRRGHTPIERVVVVAEGTKRRAVQIDLAPPLAKRGAAAPTPAPTSRRGAPIGGIVFGGLAVGFVGAFALLSFSGTRDLDRMHDTCGRTGTCLDSDIHAVKVKLIAGDAFLAASIASVSVGVGLTIRHYTSDAEPEHPPALRISLVPAAGGAVASASFQY